MDMIDASETRGGPKAEKESVMKMVTFLTDPSD